MTRRVVFSSGHRYWLASLSDEENRELFGRWASPFNHGHNYVLDVTVEGSVDPGTGMVLNIKRIDDLLRARVLKVLDQRSLNDEVPVFRNRATTLEFIMLWLWEVISGSPIAFPGRYATSLRWDSDITRAGPVEDQIELPPSAILRGIRLEETPRLYGELERRSAGAQMTITRIYEFAAAHRLDLPNLSQEENVEMFGKCNNPGGHGHNYVLEVTVQGIPDSRSGMLVDLDDLDDKVKAAILDRYDHKNLNLDVPELAGKIPTSENVSLAIFEELRKDFHEALLRIRLHETARNIFEVAAQELSV